jgi:ATP-binding cassette subfamily B protein
LRIVAVHASHPLQSIAQGLHPYRWRLVAGVLVFALKDSPLWLLPIITGAAIDVVVRGGPAHSLAWLALAAAVLLLQNYPSNVLFVRLYMGAIRSLGAGMRNALTMKLQLLSVGYYSRSSTSLVQSKLVRDVENVELMCAQTVSPVLSAILVFVGAVVMTAIRTPQFLPALALSVPCGIGVWWLMRRRSHLRNEQFRQEMEIFASKVGNMAAMMPITKAHGIEDVAAQRIAQGAEDVRRRALALDMLNSRFGAASWVALQLLSVGCLLFAAAVATLDWSPVTAGDVVVLGTYFTALTGAVTSVLNLVPIIARGRESARSIGEVLEEPDLEHNDDKRPVTSLEGSIELNHVTVRYPDADEPALDAISLRIRPGQTVAFVGPSGSGKSTLMNTVMGFTRPTSGTVLIDGMNIDELDLRTVRRRIAVVPQDSVLFEGSIRDNVTFGMDPVEDERVRQALRTANALEFVESLPQGWNTSVGERGAGLSGGQRQRLSIARAVLRNPSILFLDEATSALDADSENRVQNALESLMRGRTTLIVAHRLATIRNADLIVVLEHGCIVDQGNHTELVQRSTAYSKAWAIQSP